MDVSEGGIEAFEGKPWVRSWCYRRLPCVIYATPLGHAFNGYVQVPSDSPLLVIGMAHDIVQQAQSRFPMSAGYDGVQQLIDDIHGGLTYGPDEQGWVGFDTAHAWDQWDLTALTQELIDAGDQVALDHQAAMASVMAIMGQPFPDSWNDPAWNRSWTLDLLIDETNRLAEMVADTDQVLRQVRKILEAL